MISPLNAHSRTTGICQYFLMGNCCFGENCRYFEYYLNYTRKNVCEISVNYLVNMIYYTIYLSPDRFQHTLIQESDESSPSSSTGSSSQSIISESRYFNIYINIS